VSASRANTGHGCAVGSRLTGEGALGNLRRPCMHSVLHELCWLAVHGVATNCSCSSLPTAQEQHRSTCSCCVPCCRTHWLHVLPLPHALAADIVFNNASWHSTFNATGGVAVLDPNKTGATFRITSGEYISCRSAALLAHVDTA
jgi:hypothetical protein